MKDLRDRIEVLVARRSADERGWLHVPLGRSQLPAELQFGEVYVIRSLARGDRRGDHLHRLMEEWFSVVDGEASLRLFDPRTGERLTLPMSSELPRTVRVPAGVAHCIVNEGQGPMTVIAWASREHDPTDVVHCPAG